jgi:hypothetical protein
MVAFRAADSEAVLRDSAGDSWCDFQPEASQKSISHSKPCDSTCDSSILWLPQTQRYRHTSLFSFKVRVRYHLGRHITCYRECVVEGEMRPKEKRVMKDMMPSII